MIRKRSVFYRRLPEGHSRLFSIGYTVDSRFARADISVLVLRLLEAVSVPARKRAFHNRPGGVKPLQKFWFRIRYTLKTVCFPLICLQFVRTLVFPTPFDVLLLFLLFLAYLGFILEYY